MTTYNIQALRGPSDSDCQVYGLNANGEVAGVAFPETPEIGIEGVLWLGGGPIFNLPHDSESILYSVNKAGDAVGVRGIDNTPTEIPILVRGGGSNDLSGALGVGALCTDVNDSGVLCGSSFNNPNAFTYDTFANKLTLIPLTANQRHNYATAINQAGHVVGAAQNNDNNGTSNGFFYDGALHDLGQVAFVEDINDKGQVVGSVGAAYPASFSPRIWDVTQNPPAAQPIPLPTSDAFIGAHADSINNAGAVVGTCWTAASYDGDQTAYICANGVSTDLNTLISAPGWHLQFATRINDAGMISGFGTLNGQQTSFLLTPVHSRWGRFIDLPELVAILIFGGVTVGGGGWVVLPGGGPPIPVGPWAAEGWNMLSSSKRDALIAMALDEVAKYIADANVRTDVRNAILEGMRTSVGQLSSAGAKQVEMAVRRLGTVQMTMGKTTHALRRFGIAQP